MRPSRDPLRIWLAVVTGFMGFAVVTASARAADVGRLSMLTTTPDGRPGNELTLQQAVSPDGRFIAFHSLASDLVPGDTNGRADVFVRDRHDDTITRVSVSALGVEADGSSGSPAMSADGRYIAFYSDAKNLIPGDRVSGEQIYLRDMRTGQVVRVTAGLGSNRSPFSLPAISGDGRYVAFSARVRDWMGYWSGSADILVYDRLSGGITCITDGSLPSPYRSIGYYPPSMSADGRYVAFASDARGLVDGDTNGLGDVFVHDRQSGRTTRVSVDSAGGEGLYTSDAPSISADGRFVAFLSESPDLVADDTNEVNDVFVHDLLTSSTRRVSVSADGVQADDASLAPAISADGRWVTFASYAANLVARPDEYCLAAYVRDLAGGDMFYAGALDLRSFWMAGDEASVPAISGDGSSIVFPSPYPDPLVARGSTGCYQMWAWDRRDVLPPKTAADVVPSYDTSARITLSATDAHSTVVQTEWRLDEGAWSQGSVIDVVRPGAHTIQYRSTDSAGNIEHARIATFTVHDVTPPMTVADIQVCYDTRADITLVPADDASDVAETMWRLDGGPWNTGLVVSVVSAGPHLIEYRSIDSAGNVEAIHSGVFTVRDVIPPVTSSDLKAHYENVAVITLEATDTASSMARTQWRVDDGAWIDGTVVRVDTPGSHRLEFRSSDAAGNVETTKSGSFAVYVPTEVSLTCQSISGLRYGRSYAITGRLLSRGSGVFGQPVVLESAEPGAAFRDTMVGITCADGTFRFDVKPVKRRMYRVRGAGSVGFLASGPSETVTVTPSVALGRPIVPRLISRSAEHVIHGQFGPASASSSSTVQVNSYQLVGGRWVLRGVVRTTLRLDETGAVYEAVIRPTRRGTWRFVAYSPADETRAAARSVPSSPVMVW